MAGTESGKRQAKALVLLDPSSPWCNHCLHLSSLYCTVTSCVNEKWEYVSLQGILSSEGTGRAIAECVARAELFNLPTFYSMCAILVCGSMADSGLHTNFEIETRWESLFCWTVKTSSSYNQTCIAEGYFRSLLAPFPSLQTVPSIFGDIFVWGI